MLNSELEQLKEGDVVGICPAGSVGNYTKWKTYNIHRVTKTQITLDNGRRFLKRNGKEVGSDPYRYASLVTALEVEDQTPMDLGG